MFGVYFYTFLPRFFDNTIFSYHTIQLFPYSQCFIASLWNLFGGGKENRTPDPLLAKQMLSQLSYTPNCWWVWEDLNFRPHAYQACALTTWATNPYLFQYRLATTAIKGYVDSITSAHQSLFFERRWSSRRFPYGYLVTTSPQSLTLPWSPASDCSVSSTPSGRTNSHGVTGGVYKTRERIHRGMLIRDY